MAIIVTNKMSIKMIRENSELVEVRTSAATMDASREVPPKTKNRTTISSSYTTPGNIPK